ncbi:DUF6452 family protein [Phocaeicola abscessus]|uniref:DUF6452 family protein n=1 Tax=Phocaeicola abscessus TaxID=555313 RepID=UPI0003866CA3|nr:DUF6452 family protein [Phocaeicola abscessus]EPT33888.1 hypothetical protein HMPREF9012_1183 [Bacteroidetes bacterium oral taxon 272 str. F0290]
MKKIIPILIVLWSVAAIGGLNSCSEDNCPTTTTSVAYFDFLNSDTHSPLSLTSTVTVTASKMMDVIVKDTLSNGTIVERIVKDSIVNDTVYNAESKLSNLSLPLSYSTKTTYTIQYTDLMRDVIELTHRPIPFVSDIACGVLMFYEIEDLKYTTNALDSIALVNPNINNEKTTNFHIYYTVPK